MKLSLQTSVVQLIGICVCGFATKRSSSEFVYGASILVYSLVHFVLGLIVHSNPIASRKLIVLYEKSLLLISCLYAPLLNIQLLTLLHDRNHHITLLVTITALLTALWCVFGKRWRLFLNAFVVAHCALLVFLSASHDRDNVWLHSLAILVALNFFAIPELADRYAVPKQELLSISLIFQNFFLLKSWF